MVRQTSVDCYYEIMEEGLIGDRQKIVYDFIIDNENLTDMEITIALGYKDPNKIRPRRKELFDFGLILDGGIKKCSITGRKAHFWKINPKPDLDSLRGVKKKKKIKCSFCNGKGYYLK